MGKKKGLIKVDGKHPNPDEPFSKNMQDTDIIVYAHKFQSIRTWFKRKSHIKITTGWYARDKKIYGIAGHYRRGRGMGTEKYDPDNLLHKGWGVGSIGGLLGGWTFEQIPVVGKNPIVDAGIDYGLGRVLYVKRYFVALTMDDLVPPSAQKFIRGQEFPTEVFLETLSHTTFDDVYKALCDLKSIV